MRALLLTAFLLAGCAGPGGESVRMPAESMEPNIAEGARVAYEPVASADEVATFIEGGAERWGKPGDVLLYYPGNERDRPTPIVHRAMAYVDVRPDDAQPYRVRWGPSPCEGGATREEADGSAWCTYGPSGVVAPSIALERPFTPVDDGFFTKGDNPATNPRTDQEVGLSRERDGGPRPVPLAWILGRATSAE